MDVATSIERYDHLVNLAYQGTEESQPWLGFVDHLANAFDARDATLFIYSKRRRSCLYFVSSDRAPNLTEMPYVSEVLRLTFQEMEYQSPAIQPVTAGDTIWQSLTYTKYLQPLGVNHLLYQDLHHDDDMVIRLALERTRFQDDFGPLEKQILSLITPHLRRALAIYSDMEEKSLLSAQYLDLLSRMSIGTVVIDANRRVLTTNGAADAILAKCGSVNIAQGCLTVAKSAPAAKLRQALDMMIAAHEHESTVQRGVSVGVNSHDGLPELDVVVKPLFLGPMSGAKVRPAVLVLLNECQSGSVEMEARQLREIYNLTDKEAQLVALLAKGYTLNEAAEHLEISINTIKKHLKGLYAKLGMHRRSQVVTMLSRCTAKFL